MRPPCRRFPRGLEAVGERRPEIAHRRVLRVAHDRDPPARRIPRQRSGLIGLDLVRAGEDLMPAVLHGLWASNRVAYPFGTGIETGSASAPANAAPVPSRRRKTSSWAVGVSIPLTGR